MKKLFSTFAIMAAATLLFVACDKNKQAAEVAEDDASVTLSQQEVSLGKEETATLTLSTKGLASDAPIFWRSMNPVVATVKDGVITGVSGGKTQIIAGWHQYRDTCEVSVVVPLTKIELNMTERELKLGKTIKLKAAPSPADATDPWELTWSSDNAAVATVNEDGVVTGVSEGDANITAKVGSVTATCRVMVREKISALVQTAANIKGIYFELAANWVSNQNVLTYECLMRGDSFKNPSSNANSLFGVEGSWLLRIGDVAPLANNQLEIAGGGWQTKAVFEPGEWYHLALVWDYPNQKAYLYLNGELIEEGTANKQAQIAGSNWGQKCRIGASYLDGSVNNRFFDGAVAEMRVWNVARTAEQIAECMYEYDVDTNGNTGLLAYWKFNEGEGNSVTDYSGNNRTITAIGGNITWEDVALP